MYPSDKESLLTGASSGLGRYIYEYSHFCRRFNRNNIYEYTYYGEGVNRIIHCAWDTKYTEIGHKYITNAIEMAEKLLKIPHEQFVFLSSIDVYPKFDKEWKETDNIDVRDICGLYALTKYLVEQIILEKATNPLIIRTSILLGPYTQGTILKLAKNQDISLSLKSEYNFTLCEEILEVIRFSKYNRLLTGIYNVVANNNIKLAKLCDKPVKDGDFVYKAGYINNDKIVKVCPWLYRTSKEKFNIWQDDLKM